MTAAEIRFVRQPGQRIAVGVSGDGPPLVAAAWWVSHLEMDWRDDKFRSFWEAVGAGHTLVRYDHPGVGLSERRIDPSGLTLDGEVELLAAVMDGLGWERASLVGGSSGGCAAVAFAARFPERVDRLLLYGAYASGASIAPPAARDAIVSTVRGHWGLGSRVLADIFLGDARSAERDAFVRHQRAATDAETAAALLELASGMDVRALLDRVRAPTVVVRRRGDRAIPYACAPELAASIPDARLIPVEGSAHFPWVGNSMSVARAMRLRLLPERPAGPHASAVSVLSAREREVLALVATGMTDREIAERLTVSPHTAHRHVANIRRKLGSSSRTSAVAEAARLGLI